MKMKNWLTLREKELQHCVRALDEIKDIVEHELSAQKEYLEMTDEDDDQEGCIATSIIENENYLGEILHDIKRIKKKIVEIGKEIQHGNRKIRHRKRHSSNAK